MTEVAIPDTGVQLMLSLQEAGAVTPVSLDLDTPISFDRYESLLFFFGRIKKSSSWWLGDTIIFGEHTLGQEVAQAATATGLAPETLSHYASVCSKVPKSRRRESLSFGVHALVADRAPRAQEQWLVKAAKNGWGTAELRAALREADEKAKGEQETLVDVPLARKIDKDIVVEIGYAILRDARETDDGYAVIPIETLARLRAAIEGE